jgi:hypothetical protein
MATDPGQLRDTKSIRALPTRMRRYDEDEAKALKTAFINALRPI